VRWLAFPLLLLGCASRVQRAEVAGLAEAPAPAVEARSYVVDAARSTFAVYAVDVFGAEHRMRFGRWEATVDVGTTSHLVATVDMSTVEIDTPAATGTVKRHLLEVDQFPTATLDASLSRTHGDEHVVAGIADLHGVRRSLRFVGTLRAEGDGYRFKTEFVLSRKAFRIRYAPVEPFLRDDVRVVLDAFAHAPS